MRQPSAGCTGTWLEYALLIFPDQHLSNDQQVEFTKRFGELEFDLVPISNVKKDGSVRVEDDSDEMIQVLKGNMGWHCDSTYMPVQAKGAVFTAHVVPPILAGKPAGRICAPGMTRLMPPRKRKSPICRPTILSGIHRKRLGFQPKRAAIIMAMA